MPRMTRTHLFRDVPLVLAAEVDSPVRLLLELSGRQVLGLQQEVDGIRVGQDLHTHTQGRK